jgi:outer membrane protein
MRSLIALSVALVLMPAAQADDLLQVFDRATTNDPQIREADALRKASRESKPQALAALLPQVSGSAARTWDDQTGFSDRVDIITDPSAPGGRRAIAVPSGGASEPESRRWSVDLRQSVFSWSDWVALKRADKQVAQAEADYEVAQQDLALRAAQRYFDVLAAQDNVTAQQSALEAISRQLEQAEKRFEVGLIAITDVQEAKAARDNGAAALIAAKRQLASAEEFLRELLGDKPASLAKPAESMPLATPSPAEENQWVELSMNQNLALTSSRLAADIARDNVRSAFAGHLPAIDLVASRSAFEQETTTDLPASVIPPNGQTLGLISDTDSTSYSLQLSVPLFSGGATQSRVRESEFRWQAARERLERTSRQTERQARDAYLGVLSGISRVQALKQALESTATALKATEAGYEVGTRTAVDVLDSRRRLAQAETDYARSRYDYILSVLQLRLAAGTLDRKALEEVNGWLAKTP